jgi:hypothetical protein
VCTPEQLSANQAGFPEGCSLKLADLEAGKAALCDYFARWQWTSGRRMVEFSVYSVVTDGWIGVGFNSPNGSQSRFYATEAEARDKVQI